MAFMMTVSRVDDYEAWKAMFDSNPNEIRSAAKGHRIFRSADDPNEIVVHVEFNSVSDANTARDQLVASGVLDRITVEAGPIVTEEAEAVEYS